MKPWTPPLALAVLTALTYANAVPRALVHDDQTALAQNPRFGGIERIPALFRESVWEGVGGNQRLYRPLAMASLALDRTLYGGDPRGYHWTSIALHVAATLVVYALLVTLGAGAPGAFLGGLVFGVHPVHTEAVDVALNRSEILACLAVTAGLAWFFRHVESRPTWACAGASVLYLLGLLCRESAVTLPVLLLLGLLLMKPAALEAARRRWPLALLAFVLPILIYALARSAALSEPVSGLVRSLGSEGIGGAGAPLRRLALVASTLRDYLRLMVWPWPLRASYEDYVPRAVTLAVLLLVALLAIAVAARKRFPALTFGLAFFYVALLPSTRLFADPATMAERFLYLPSAGLMVPLAFAFTWWATRLGAPQVPLVAGCTLCAVLAGATLKRNAAWQSREALWEAEIQVAPDDWRVLLNLAQVRVAQGRMDEAVALCDRGLLLDPTRTAFHTNRGVALVSLGRLAEAEQSFLRVVEGASDPIAWANLARVYVRTERLDRASEAYQKAVAATGDEAMRLVLEGEHLLLVQKDPAAASAAFEHALVLSPRLTAAHDGDAASAEHARPRARTALSEGRHLVRQLAVAVGLYAVLTVALTWPLATRLHVMDAGDSAFFAWADRLGAARPQDRPRAPAPRATSSIRCATRSAWTSRSSAPPSSSCRWRLSPTTRSSCSTWPGCSPSSLSALTAYLLARELGCGEGPALFAGAAFAFSPIRTDQIAHLSTLGTQWLPLVAALHAPLRADGPRRDALLAAAVLRAGDAGLRLSRR